MMPDINKLAPQRTIWTRWILPLAGGAMVGALTAFFGMDLIDDGALGALSSSAVAALAAGATYIVTGIFVGIGAISPRLGATFLNVEDAEELREMRQTLTTSGIAMVMSGMFLVVLALASPGSIIAPRTGAFVAAACLLVLGIASVRSHQRVDELMREVGRETGSLSFYLSFLIIGGWGAAAHLQLAPAPAMLSILTMFAAIVLIATYWVCGRRGMLNRR